MRLDGNPDRASPILATSYQSGIACRGEAVPRPVATNSYVARGRGGASPLLAPRAFAAWPSGIWLPAGRRRGSASPLQISRASPDFGRAGVGVIPSARLPAPGNSELCRDGAPPSEGEGVQHERAGEYRTESQSDKPRYPTLTHSHPCWSDFIVFALQRISRSNNP